MAKKVARELADAQQEKTVLFCNVRSKRTLEEVATSISLVCSEKPNLPENPQQWLLNWSKRLKENVTFVLDNADDVLDHFGGERFF